MERPPKLPNIPQRCLEVRLGSRAGDPCSEKSLPPGTRSTPDSETVLRKAKLETQRGTESCAQGKQDFPWRLEKKQECPRDFSWSYPKELDSHSLFSSCLAAFPRGWTLSLKPRGSSLLSFPPALPLHPFHPPEPFCASARLRAW